MMEISWAVISAAVALPIVYWLWWRWTHRRLLQLAAQVPGSPALPIVGNALIFLRKPKGLLNVIETYIKRHGQYAKFWLGPELNVCVTNPDDIRLLLTSNKVTQKGPVYNCMKNLIGPGILTGGSSWRNHRKIVNPSYNKKSVQQYSAIFNKETENLADVLSRKDPDVTYDVYYDVVNCTTQCVCQTLMGLSKNESRNVRRLDEIVLKTQSFYEFTFIKMTHWWLQIPLVFWLTGKKQTEDNYKKLINEMTSDILEKRRKALLSKLQVEEEITSVVDRYILSGELSEQEVKWETFTLFTTSQEASAKVASALLLALAYLPNWQEKVYNEIIEVLGSRDDFVTVEEIKKLRSLDMVYKETLRYMSIAAFIQRTVEKEIPICEGKLTLPAGACVIIPIHMLHRDPLYWDEPDRFKPERFEPENIKQRNPNAFIPFSLGAMDCLGRVYATSLIKILVVRVLRRVELQADGMLEDLDLQVAISVKFAKGFNLRSRKRRTN